MVIGILPVNPQYLFDLFKRGKAGGKRPLSTCYFCFRLRVNIKGGRNPATGLGGLRKKNVLSPITVDGFPYRSNLQIPSRLVRVTVKILFLNIMDNSG